MDRSSTNPVDRVPIFALLGADGVSLVGDALSRVAIPWFVLETTGSAAKMGLTGAVLALAIVLAGLFGGPLVDRLGYKRTSIAADLASGAAVASIPLLHLTVGLAFWQLLVVVFLGTLLDVPGGSARFALIPDLARRAGMPTERANAVNSAIPRFAILVGPLLAGALIPFFGASNVLWLDAATFAVSAGMVAAGVPASSRVPDRAAAEGARSGGGYLAELFEGLRFVFRHRLILSIGLVVTITNALDAPKASVVLPVYADTVLGGAAGLGFMLGGFGGGALAGTLLFGAVGHRLPRRGTFIASFVAVGLPFWILAAEPSLPVAVAALAFGGFASGPLNPLIGTLVQEHTPVGMLGRVDGAISAMVTATAPIGLVLVGYLVEVAGLRFTLLGMSVCYLAVTLSMLVNPAFRDMNEPTQAPSDTPTTAAESTSGSVSDR